MTNFRDYWLKLLTGCQINNFTDFSYVLWSAAFHEAVGDIIILSASTMKHLKKIGLLEYDEIDQEVILNNLYKVMQLRFLLQFHNK